ncbi:reverse transcriptase domain-containing protein [Patescibacteria group bacterium]
MSSKLPRFLRSSSKYHHNKEREIQPRLIVPPNPRAIRNLSRLSVGQYAEGLHPVMIEQLMFKLVSGEIIKSRLEPKSTPGQFRELWIPTDPIYKYLLERLAFILGSFSTSPEAIAFRKNMSPAKGLRLMIDEYEGHCAQREVQFPKDNPIIGTSYQGDIKSYYDNITFDQVRSYLSERIPKLLEGTLSAEEAEELANLIADLVCPGESLPQGFSTSPAIANGVGVPLDRNIRRMVRQELGDSQVSVMGRYADDLVVFASGDYNRRIMSIISMVLGQAGFKLHPNKVGITKARKEGSSSRIEVFGTEIKNDGVAPLHFTTVGRYNGKVLRAIEHVLGMELSEKDAVDEVMNPSGGHLCRIMGGLGYIAHINRWGKPLDTPFRNRQTTMLPKKLEKAWLALRSRLESFLTEGQRTFIDIKEDDVKAVRKEVGNKSAEERFNSIFSYRTKWRFEINEDLEKGGSFKVFDGNELIAELDEEILKDMGFPEDPEDIEDFLLEQEEKISERIKEISKRMEDEEITSYKKLQESPELYKDFHAIYLEFVKMHLLVTFNIAGLEKEDLENLFDTSSIELDEETGFPSSENDIVLPWGFEELYDSFSDKFQSFLSESMTQVFTIPEWKNYIIKGRQFSPKSRRKGQKRRDGKGYYVKFPEFDKLRTRSGVPVTTEAGKKKIEEEKSGKSNGQNGSSEPDSSFDQLVFEKQVTT